jgi:hypothetical protein
MAIEEAPALRAPQPCKAVFQEATLQELPQHPLDHRAQRATLPHKTRGPDAEQLFEVLFHEPVERRFTRTSRPVNPATDLHAQPEAGGEAPAARGGGLGGHPS